MTEPSAGPDHLHRRRLFFGICLALIPTGASFALVSNILVPLKQQFILTNYQVGLTSREIAMPHSAAPPIRPTW